MDFEKYTERSRGFLQAAQTMALARGHQRFAPEHLLKVLIDDPEGMAAGLIKAAGGKADVVKARNEDALAKIPKVEGGGAGNLYLAPEMARLFEAAEKMREKAGDSFVAAERLLQALGAAGRHAGRRCAEGRQCHAAGTGESHSGYAQGPQGGFGLGRAGL
jgi:ATP-dependent Clp protease ATP-binding subunit ClpB